ncbi:MAG: hypothetical protein Q7R47_03670 [Candidatus Diapherotrites archaeon]|nr:hypothetical protein [Candidatus Diapherotrites archaeon]
MADEAAEDRERKRRIEAITGEIKHLGSSAEQEAKLGQLSDAEQREVKNILPPEMLRGIEDAKEKKKTSIQEVLSRNPRME